MSADWSNPSSTTISRGKPTRGVVMPDCHCPARLASESVAGRKARAGRSLVISTLNGSTISRISGLSPRCLRFDLVFNTCILPNQPGFFNFFDMKIRIKSGIGVAPFPLTDKAIITILPRRKSDFLSIATNPGNTAEISRIFSFLKQVNRMRHCMCESKR